MAYRKIVTSDRNLQMVQDAVASAINTLSKSAISSNHLVTHVSLKAGQDNLISHGLGRIPQIWVVVDLDTNTNIWSPTSTQISNQSANDQYINIQCATDCTASFLFSKGI